MGKFKPKVLFVISQTITTLALITICIYSFINELSHVQTENNKSLHSAPTVFLKKTDPESYANGTMLEDSNINDQSLIKVVLLMGLPNKLPKGINRNIAHQFSINNSIPQFIRITIISISIDVIGH